MKGVDPEVDAALAPPQLASLALADQTASPSEGRTMAGEPTTAAAAEEAASACTVFPGIYFYRERTYTWYNMYPATR
jgi:hypothetical protein